MTQGLSLDGHAPEEPEEPEGTDDEKVEYKVNMLAVYAYLGIGGFLLAFGALVTVTLVNLF